VADSNFPDARVTSPDERLTELDRDTRHFDWRTTMPPLLPPLPPPFSPAVRPLQIAVGFLFGWMLHGRHQERAEGDPAAKHTGT
jgi:hypothetical protein